MNKLMLILIGIGLSAAAFAAILSSDYFALDNVANFLAFEQPSVFSPFPHVDRLNSEYMLPTRFVIDLKEFVSRAPINPKTGSRQMMVFLTSDKEHLDYGANMYCSLMAAGFLKDHLIFLALNRESYTEMQDLGIPCILLTEKVPKCMVTVFRLSVMLQLLMWGVEVLHCDTDAVFMGHPYSLILNDGSVDWEVAIENPVVAVTKRLKVWSINGGFWKMYPHDASIRWIRFWINYCYTLRQPDQESMIHFFQNHTAGEWTGDSIYTFDLQQSIGTPLRVKYIDPLLATLAHSIFCEKHRKMYRKAGAPRGITRPVLFHMAWYWPSRKPSCLFEKNLWFTEYPKSRHCKEVPPNGTECFWDRKYDLVSPIPRKVKGRKITK